VKPPTTPRGSKGKPASAPGTTTATPGPEANGAPADANTAPAEAGQGVADFHTGGVVAVSEVAPIGDGRDEAILPLSRLPDGSFGVDAPAPGTDSQASTDQAPVATAPETPADAGAPNAEDGAGDAEASDPGDGTISGAEAAALTIRDFARTETGEIARDSRGRAVVEERPLRETDILGDRVDGDIVHFVLADGRKISVRK
jgi:hypothetical protein